MQADVNDVMANKALTNQAEDLLNQIRNIDVLIKAEEETARLNATTNKDVSMQALNRKRNLQSQKNQIIVTLKAIASQNESENEAKETEEFEDVIKTANKTKTMAEGVLKKEIDKQRKIISRSKSKDDPENTNESFFSTPPGMGLVIICAAVLLGLFLKTRTR